MKYFAKALIIDDDEVSVYISTKVLIKSGVVGEIKSIYSSSNALLLLLDKSIDVPDLILLDMQLPVLTGCDLLEKLRMEKFNFDQTLILPLTSSVNPSDYKKLKDFGINNILLKPLTVDKLLDCVHKIIKPGQAQ